MNALFEENLCMGTLTIRDVPEDVIQALGERAAEVGMSREAWVRLVIGQLAKGPQVRMAYQLHCFQRDELHETMGRIVRQSDGKVTHSIVNPTVLQLEAFHKALELVKRNAFGDREQAIAYLANAFDGNVFELPAASPALESHELGFTFRDAHSELLLRNDGTAWRRELPAGNWTEIEDMSADVVLRLVEIFRQQKEETSQLILRLADLERKGSVARQV
jgi:plasmid stability protein